MSSSLERQLVEELELRGREAPMPPMSRVAKEAVRSGVRLRRRRTLGVIVGTALAAVGVTATFSVIANDDEAATIIGPAQHPENGSLLPSAGNKRPTKPTPSPSKTPDRETTPCKAVPSPPAVEMDTLLYKKDGFLRYSYSDPKTGKELTFTIAYRDDPDCKQDPALRRLIEHVLDAADY